MPNPRQKNILMKSALYLVFAFFVMNAMIGCGNSSAPKNRGAIVFGDSSTIVTEKDPKFLSNNVEDFIPQKAVENTDTVAVMKQEQVIDSPKQETVKALVTPTVNTNSGLNAPFKSLEVFIEGIKARAGKNIDWNKDRGASFTLESGSLNGKTITIKGATVTKLMQRVQTALMLKAPNGKIFKLSALPSSTGEWQTLKGANGNYDIKGIAEGQLKYTAKFSPNVLRNAAQKWARNNRLNKKDEQKLLSSIRNVRSYTQAPCSIALQSVVWKISAKDASGKPIERELRLDINL